jgi:hypothetical protein
VRKPDAGFEKGSKNIKDYDSLLKQLLTSKQTKTSKHNSQTQYATNEKGYPSFPIPNTAYDYLSNGMPLKKKGNRNGIKQEPIPQNNSGRISNKK